MASLRGFLLFAASGVPVFCFASSVLAQTNQSPTELERRFARHYAERPPVQFEIAENGERGPRIIITNLQQYPLTAYVVQTVPKSADEAAQTIVCDALTRVMLLAPIPRGLSHVLTVPRRVGGPAPDATLAAAVWDDGSTYGPDDLLLRISNGRSAFADNDDRALALLQTGLDKNWSAREYLAAAESLQSQTRQATTGASAAELSLWAQSDLPIRTITIDMQRLADENGPATASAQGLLTYLTQQRDALRRALSGSTVSANQRSNQ
jgi:hypothetical protein